MALKVIKLGDKGDITIKEGALHKQLGFPPDQKIPVTLLKKIKVANIGDKISYTVNGKKKTIKVTPLLKKRVNLALVMRSWRK